MNSTDIGCICVTTTIGAGIRLQQIADVHLPQPHQAGHRRGDAAIAQVQLRRLDRGLIGGHRGLILRHRRDLRGIGLVGDGFLRQQRLVALQIDLGIGQQRLIALELALRLIQRGLEWTRIDQRQQVAGLDDLPFGEGDLDQRAGDLRMHGDGRQRRDGAERVDGDRHVAGGDLGDADRQRAAGAEAARSVVWSWRRDSAVPPRSGSRRSMPMIHQNFVCDVAEVHASSFDKPTMVASAPDAVRG